MGRLGLAVAVVTMAALAGEIPAAHGSAIEYFTETTKDFGTTPKGPVLIHYFPIKNTSKNTVTMGTPRIQCGCVSVSLLKATLAPGEETSLIAFLDTKKIPTHQLNVMKSVAVYIPFIQPVYEEVTVKVVTVARDDLYLSPDTLAMGTVRKGQTATASVKLTMFTQPQWNIKEVKSTGAFVIADVKLVKRQGAEVTFEVTATLEKDCPVGNWMSDVYVSSNAPGLERFRVPVTVNVIAPISASPNIVKFGNVSMGSTPSQQLIVQAAEPFKVLDLKSDKDLKVTTVTEGARAVHIFKITLDANSAGELARKLEIRTDSKSEGAVIVPVSATVSR